MLLQRLGTRKCGGGFHGRLVRGNIESKVGKSVHQLAPQVVTRRAVASDPACHSAWGLRGYSFVRDNFGVFLDTVIDGLHIEAPGHPLGNKANLLSSARVEEGEGPLKLWIHVALEVEQNADKRAFEQSCCPSGKSRRGGGVVGMREVGVDDEDEVERSLS